MTKKEAIKEIADYFGLELNDFDKKKLIGILDNLTVKQVFVKTLIEPNEPLSFDQIKLDDYAHIACAKFGITHKQFVGKERYNKYVDARCYFARSVVKANRDYPQTWISDYIKRDHTVVNHYLYHRKDNLEIGLFKMPLKKVNSSIKQRK